jgi:hypothetical protein
VGWLFVCGRLSVLAGVRASATHYLRHPPTPASWGFSIVLSPHVVLGGVYLMLATLQFVKGMRSPWWLSRPGRKIARRKEY